MLPSAVMWTFDAGLYIYRRAFASQLLVTVRHNKHYPSGLHRF